jgi:hypothetical protein
MDVICETDALKHQLGGSAKHSQAPSFPLILLLLFANIVHSHASLPLNPPREPLLNAPHGVPAPSPSSPGFKLPHIGQLLAFKILPAADRTNTEGGREGGGEGEDSLTCLYNAI